ncbi:septum site-determining protein Ssd [Arthrobacter agilis]|uniref:septum site-determining protein Ssd n=1 Tax=Arthrobacter agilis TaxID=37921 RepID=UPI00278076FA|nr:septum site-determining protein Ssd [Arthrobacter agilis]MDQ0736039.1 secretion/DNA translocation related CpaE-like protein [Arthrobacter agilis]
MRDQAWTPNARRRPVVLAGGSQYVQDQVARACAAAGVAPAFVGGLGEALSLDPAVLLVGPDQAEGGSTGHREVIVVGASDDEPRIWGAAANLASSRVVVLPQGAGWLAEHLAGRLNPAAGGSVVGFLGAAGGCGASTFAFWCARSLAQQGRATLLVDGNPLAGGLDLALGLDERPGVRWSDLRELRGTLNAAQLRSALPADGNLSVLSHSAGAADGGEGMASATAVLDAARGAFDLSVVDLGGRNPVDRSLSSSCDHLVLLVPSRPRSVAAVDDVLSAYGSVPVTVVLRGPVLDGLDAWHVAELTGRTDPLPYLPVVRGAAAAEAGGSMLGFALPRRVRKVVRTVCAGLENTG